MNAHSATATCLSRALRALTLLFIPALALLVAMPVARAAKAPAGATVEVFVRKAGSPHAWASVHKEGAKRFELGKLALANERHADVQYDARLELRGIRLGALLDLYKPPATVDLALLHFANGMTVPLPFRDAEVMTKLDPFIATAVIEDGKPQPLPQLRRKVENYADVKDLTFNGNKLSLAARFHPETGWERAAEFSPWVFVDTLLAVELVKSDAYYKQPAVDDTPEVAAGLTVFRMGCQSCHGTRRLGAHLGTDFVEPKPVTQRVAVGRLLFHVLYRSASEMEAGARMPAIGFLNEDDARKLFVWLKAVGDKPLRPYAP